jgi:hypothetical protein
LRVGRAIETLLTNVLDDAHDFPRPRAAIPEVDIHLLPERITRDKAAARHRLVDEQHRRLSRDITVVEAAAGDQIGAHGSQKIAADDPRVWLLGRRKRCGLIRRYG